ncbi:murein hydrolase activator EnvC family protein [Edaphocola aurantiacus]|uniref:murein hydrolase activator EnvC family protein n=1 Tax=Edaphocola aurantiacus TaxID=2601682 RepID=UPI001FE84266|nr:peptidoglycan DD-metalloendopeptidase family protein [Edaphocola aurantiacus]
MRNKIAGTLVFITLLSAPVWAQKNVSKTDLQSRREAILQEIRNAQALLNEAKESQNVTLTELRALNHKLELRQQLINNISLELNNISTDISTTNTDIKVLNAQLAKFQADYARSVRYAYKHQESQNMMLFVFSANTFNDMMRRMEYMKKYRQYRTIQANKIREIQGTLKQKVGYLNNKKSERSELLSAEQVHKAAIEADANETQKVAQVLKGQVSDLSSQIAKNKKAAAQLETAIKIQIQKEIEEARRQAMEEARQRALAEARAKAAEENRRRAEDIQRMNEANRLKAAEEEQRKASELARQAELARKKAAEDAERQRLKDIEDARKRREEAAAEEKRIADAKAREEQRKRNEERNKEIDRRKEEERQKELVRQKKIAEDLDKQRQQATDQATQYKSGGTVVTINKATTTPSSSSGSAPTTVRTNPESTSYKNLLTPDIQALSNNFAANKGGLPWPVDRGLIVAPYGNYQHPIEKSVTLSNSGIDIGTNANAPVKVVFSGVVTKIFSVPGMGITVLVSHGQYYTVYSKLSSATVSVGTKLTTRQTVGFAGKNDEGDNVVHFEVWKVGDNGSISNVNPTGWIAPK